VFQVDDVLSAKQFQHQLKKWDVKKYRKSDQANSDSRNSSPLNVLEREEREENQVEDSSPSSVTQLADTRSLDDADSEAAFGPFNGTPGADKITESVNGNERETQPGLMGASPSATGVSSEISIDKGSPANGEKLPAEFVGLRQIKPTGLYPSKSVDPGASNVLSLPMDPTLGSGALSPRTRSFLKFAQRISRLKRGKPSGESLSIQAKKSKRASWGRQWPDKVPSVDSLSDAISSLHLGSRRPSRGASAASVVLPSMPRDALPYSDDALGDGCDAPSHSRDAPLFSDLSYGDDAHLEPVSELPELGRASLASETWG
jgi:hypothetical protein